MEIPDEVIEQAARIAWADEPGADIAEWGHLGALGRADLMETARKAAEPIANWARRQALIEAAEAVAENPGGREVHVGVISALRQGVYRKRTD